MSEAGKRLKYVLPRGEDVLRAVTGNLLFNLRQGGEATVLLPPLIRRAYAIAHDTGVLPMQDYTQDTVFLEQQ